MKNSIKAIAIAALFAATAANAFANEAHLSVAQLKAVVAQAESKDMESCYTAMLVTELTEKGYVTETALDEVKEFCTGIFEMQAELAATRSF